MRTVVVDTNVLLSNPDVVEEFPDAEVIIPDTVLSEIDKLKTARVDAELRYKGRSISRILFELSEQGSLHNGVTLPGGGRLRVVSLNGDTLPDGLSSRNADDRIMAIALQLKNEGAEAVTLVTNDLNMLLKAQTFDISVERIEGRDSFGRQFIIRPFQRYKVPLTILAVALAVFAAIVYLVQFSPFSPGRQISGVAALPKEFGDQLSLQQRQVLESLYKLESNPRDAEMHRAVAILYDQMSEHGNTTYLPFAIRHYEERLKLIPDDVDSRTDLATCYFNSGNVAQAIEEAKTVLVQDPDHVNANFNLGIFYLNTKPKQFQLAADQFAKVISMSKASSQPQLMEAAGLARTRLDQTVKNAKAAGKPIKLGGGTL